MNDERKKNFWLIKFAPFRTPWAEIVRRGAFSLRGIRSPEARNNLKAMRVGDLALFYHSQQERSIVGVLEVTRAAYPDPCSVDAQWLTCDFRPVKTLNRRLPLSGIKADPNLEGMPLINRPRLAVMPVTLAHFARILERTE